MSSKERIASSSELRGNVQPILIGVAAGIVVCMIFLLGFSAILSTQNVPQTMIAPMSSLAAALGGFAAGFICAKITRTNGILYGLICGAILSVVMLLISLGLGGDGIGVPALFKVVFILLSAAIGGVLGVNSKKRTKKAKSKSRK